MANDELLQFRIFLEELRPDLHYTVHGDLLVTYGRLQGYMNVKMSGKQIIFQSWKEQSWSSVSGDPYSKVLWNSTLAYLFGPNNSTARAQPAKPTQTQGMQKSTDDNLLRRITDAETLTAYTDLGVLIQGLTLAPCHCPFIGMKVFTYLDRQLALECRMTTREVLMSVRDKATVKWEMRLINAIDADFKKLKYFAQEAVRELHNIDEKATAPRAEPVKTSQPQEMQNVSALREKEKTLLQEHRERQKQLKKVAKAFAVVITETVRTHLLDPERIKTGASVGRMFCALTTPDAEDVWRFLPDYLVDTGITVRKDSTDKKRLNVTVDV